MVLVSCVSRRVSLKYVFAMFIMVPNSEYKSSCILSPIFMLQNDREEMGLALEAAAYLGHTKVEVFLNFHTLYVTGNI